MAQSSQVSASMEDQELFWRGDSALLCMGWTADRQYNAPHAYGSWSLWLRFVLQVCVEA